MVAAHLQTPDSLVGLGADVQLAFGRTPEGCRQLRDHLLVAADSVTHAMSSLVRELHSGMPHSPNGRKSTSRRPSCPSPPQHSVCSSAPYVEAAVNCANPFLP